MRIVTMAPGWPVPSDSTFATRPTSTPATRTGIRFLRPITLLNGALTSKWLANGLDFVKPKYVASAIAARVSTPAANADTRGSRRPVRFWRPILTGRPPSASAARSAGRA
jgi:hypothetical protein